MQKKEEKMYSALLVIIYLAFISLGLPDTLLGSAWPQMHIELNASLSSAGIITMIISMGTVISSLFSDRLNIKLGTGKVTAISVLMTAVALLGFGPLSSYVDETGKTVTPFLDNIILIITFIFFVPGMFYGYAVGKFRKLSDMVGAMSKQIGTMGYAIVLTFFSYNFLSLLTYTNLGTYITYIGAMGLQAVGASNSPILLIIGFILITGFINLFVGGLSSKWMLLGPIFVPMLYHVNSSMTPDVVAAAYRIADSSTNIITPLMTYAGVVLMYMRKYKPEFTAGNLISMMIPYSVIFMVSWTLLLMTFILFKIPLGF